MDFEGIRKSISEKIGEEATALISDDFINMQSVEKSFNDNLEKITKERDDFKERNEKLINANASLYQKIGVEVKEPKDPEEEKKPFNFRSVFDERGNLKR